MQNTIQISVNTANTPYNLASVSQPYYTQGYKLAYFAYYAATNLLNCKFVKRG